MPDRLPDRPSDVFSNLTETMDAARQVISDVGLRTYRVFFVVERWAEGTSAGDGEPLEVTFTEIVPAPEVSFFSAARVASSGGAYREGAVELRKVTRSLRREALLGHTIYGDRRPKHERFSYGLLARGQLFAELYNPAGEPILEPLAWRIALNPISRRIEAPVLD